LSGVWVLVAAVTCPVIMSDITPPHNTYKWAYKWRYNCTEHCLEQTAVLQLVKQLPHFMEPDSPLPFPKRPAACSHPSQINPAHTVLSHFFNVDINVALQSVSFSWCLTPKFSIHFSFPSCPAHLILLDLITRIKYGEQYKSWSFSLCSFLQSLITSYFSTPHFYPITLLSNTHICSSHTVTYQIPYPCKTTGKITVMCILVFILSDNRHVN